MDTLIGTPTPTENGKFKFELSGTQTAFLEALSQKDGRLAEMYLGALIVLEDQNNPDKLAQACHSLRELMEKIPRWYEAVPAAEQLPTLGVKVRELATAWERMLRNSVNKSSGGWAGNIDKSLEKFLRGLEEFFDWFKKNKPMRGHRAAGLLRKLDPMGLPLPKKIEELRVKEWSECREYFENVAHHNISASLEEIGGWLRFLEGFLLDLVRPRTFEKHDRFDAIIKRGETNGQP